MLGCGPLRLIGHQGQRVALACRPVRQAQDQVLPRQALGLGPGSVIAGRLQGRQERPGARLEQRCGARAREVEAQAPGEVTFLSARPKELSGLSYSSLLNPLLSARGQIIAGYNLLPAPAAVPGIGNVHEVQAFAKFRNFVELATLYPESDFVFIGDSGQGDMLGGELMLYHQPERMRAVFIHQIITDGKHGILCPYPRSQSDLDRGTSRVVFFDTYIGAAAQAHEWGLISEDSLYVVTKSAIETLNQRGSEILTAKLRNLVIAQFRRDIRRVQEILANHPVDTARDRLPDLLLAESSCEKNPATKNP